MLKNEELFTNALVRALKSCKRPIRYLIYNTCLFEFTQNLAKHLLKTTLQRRNKF